MQITDPIPHKKKNKDVGATSWQKLQTSSTPTTIWKKNDQKRFIRRCHRHNNVLLLFGIYEEIMFGRTATTRTTTTTTTSAEATSSILHNHQTCFVYNNNNNSNSNSNDNSNHSTSPDTMKKVMKDWYNLSVQRTTPNFPEVTSTPVMTIAS